MGNVLEETATPADLHQVFGIPRVTLTTKGQIASPVFKVDSIMTVDLRVLCVRLAFSFSELAKALFAIENIGAKRTRYRITSI